MRGFFYGIGVQAEKIYIGLIITILITTPLLTCTSFLHAGA